MLVYVYSVYLAISVAITIWVGNTLHRNGRVFLVQNFQGNEAVADAINHMLLVGFYLLNFGLVLLTLSEGAKPTEVAAAMEFLSTKIGLNVIVLGMLHFCLMYVLVHFRDLSVFKPPPKPPRPRFLTICFLF